jgi:hypothetical protein
MRSEAWKVTMIWDLCVCVLDHQQVSSALYRWRKSGAPETAVGKKAGCV